MKVKSVLIGLMPVGLIGAGLIGLLPGEQENAFVEMETPIATVVSKDQVGTKDTSHELAGHMIANEPLLNRSADAQKGKSAFLSIETYEARSVYGPLPEHMRNGALPKLFYDANGRLIITKDVKDLIEQMLSAVNDEPLAQILARIEEYIGMILPETAAAEARELVAKYMAYREQADAGVDFNLAQMDVHTVIEKMSQKVAERKQLRRDMLPAEVVEAFFDVEERYDDFNLVRARIMNDGSLSSSEKDARVAQAEQSLPPRLKEQMEYEREENNVENKIKTLRAEGGKVDEIHALRVSFYGEETANRMAYFDDNSDEWAQRVTSFNQQYEQVMKMSDDETEKERMIQDLRASMFSPKEQVKLAVYNIRQMAKN